MLPSDTEEVSTTTSLSTGLRQRTMKRAVNLTNNINDNENHINNVNMEAMPPGHGHHHFRRQESRSLDVYLEDAFTNSPGWKWQYWIVILSLGVANSSDASEILCISYILSDDAFERQILQDDAWRGGLLASAVFLGMLLGGLFVGALGDWVGRRPMLLVGLVCNTFAGILSAMCNNVWTLSMLRCVAGVGIGATVPPLFTLATELAPPSQRGLCVTVCASFWMVGSIYVAVVAMYILGEWHWSWRAFAVACAVPSAAGAILVYFLVPASPRFLATRRQHSQALRVTNQLSQQMNFTGRPLTIHELRHHFPERSSDSIDTTNNNDSTVSESTDLSFISWFWELVYVGMIDFWTSTTSLYTPQLVNTTWPLQMVWFSLSFGSYGLVTWINTLFVEVHLKDVYFNALLFALSNLPGNLLSGFLMDRIGRSIMLVGSVVSSALSLVAFAAFAAQSTNDTPSTIGIVTSACAFQGFTIAAWNTIDCMTSELFPTTVRSTGMGVCAASGRIGAMVAQFINGALVGKPVRLLLVASITLLMGAVTPCLLPNGGDMTGRPVQDELLASGTSNNNGNDGDTLPQGDGTPTNIGNSTNDYTPLTSVSSTNGNGGYQNPSTMLV